MIVVAAGSRMTTTRILILMIQFVQQDIKTVMTHGSGSLQFLRFVLIPTTTTVVADGHIVTGRTAHAQQAATRRYCMW